MRCSLLRIIALFTLPAVLFSCGFNSNNINQFERKHLFESLAPERTGIDFSNTLVPDADMNILEYNYFYNGGGVAAADFNLDGQTDLYFTGNQVSGKLYLNRKNFTFEDVTSASGLTTKNWGTGVAVADVNDDGRPDIYLSYAGYKDPSKRKHQLFINRGNNTSGIPVFSEEAEKYGLADTSYTTQSSFFDFDRDGDLDVVMINHYQDKSNPNFPKPREARSTAPAMVRLYRNDNGRFTEMAKAAGIAENGYGLGIAISDVNQDGWADVYIARDFIFDDALYVNNGNGTFTDRLKQYIRHTSRFSMGCDIADFNNDSYPDIVTLDMLPDSNRRQKLMNTAMNNDRFNMALSLGYTPQYARNMLQLNNGPDASGAYSFSEIGQLAGVDKTDWSWSPLFADFDNDGWKDLFVSNGIPRDITNNDFISYRTDAIQRFSDYASLKKDLLDRIEDLSPVEKSGFLFKNEGDLSFSDQSRAWGLDRKGFSNGAAFVDLDNDGDLDLVTNNLESHPSIYKNNSDTLHDNNFIRIKLEGRFSIGAKISIDCRGKKQFLEHNPVRGFQSCQDPVEHFGLGADNMIDTLTVTWLDGKVQRLVHLKAGQLVTLDYRNALPQKHGLTPLDNRNPWFTDITAMGGIDLMHREDAFEDFDYEPLLPHRFSREGPYIDVADVNNDGLEDCWMGGPTDIGGKLLLQQHNGSFLEMEMPDSVYEDTGGVFFDANGDKNADLYVVSGGNAFRANSAYYQDRLYLNDGKGNFKRDSSALPEEGSSGSCVAVNDFDQDGDTDVFVGGRVLPAAYPLPPRSFVLENDGTGKFKDVTASVCPGLANIGLVTAAIWSDFDGDGWTDLIVTGEWMPVVFYRNDHGKLSRWLINPAVDSSTGWWFSIAAGDFDNDSDMDYLVGNLGLNNRFNVSPQTPMSVYAKDFGSNGGIEPIITYYLNGSACTVADRDQIASVLPEVKKKFDTYGKFAAVDFARMFTAEQLKDALHLTATNFASVYLENRGGKFVMRSLPVAAQFSVIQSFRVGDFDGDGNLDAVILGNYFSPDFITGRYDASNGLVLKGDGKGSFTAVPYPRAGLFVEGEMRSSEMIRIKNKSCFLAAVNSGRLRCFRINKR